MASTGRPQRRFWAAERDDFVGRAAEIAELRQSWTEGRRLVSVLGAGGSGKTRLALHFARSLPAPAWFCDLSNATTRLQCIEAVARTLDVPLPGRDPPESLSAVLGYALAGGGRQLLVLDNFEQVVAEARPLVEQWLDLAPELSLLVTSRERLRVRGEHCLELGPLALPEPGSDPDRVLESDAVRLFVARARAVRRDFSARPAASVLAELVTRLDGLPLAIELCAARTMILGPAQLLERLERRFETLIDRGSRSARQATLEATIDWSWQLLDPVERQALGQCATFRGDFDLAAAEQVIATTPRRATLDTLESLVDQSLVLVREGPDGERRFGLFESVREFCELRAEPSERRAAEELHARYFLARARELAAQPGRLALEAANVLAVFERGLAAGDPRRALAAALALEPVFTTQGPLPSFIQLLDRAIDAAAARGVSRREIAEARLARGLARVTSGDFSGAADDLEEVLSDAEPRSAVIAAARLGVARAWLGQLDAAEAALRDAGERLKAVDDAYLSGQVEMAWGLLRSIQSIDALAHYRAALDLFRKSGARREQAMALENVGNRYLERGALAEAEDHLTSALAMFREFGELRMEAHTLGDLGSLYTEQGRFELAESALGRALELSDRVGDRHWPGVLSGYLGDADLERGRVQAASERYLFASERLVEIGNQRYSALFRASLAGAEALLGRTTRAEELLDSARAELEQAGTADDLRAAALWAAVLDVARGQRERAERSLEQVAAAYGDDLASRPPNEVRFARRILSRLLATQPGAPATALRVAADGSWFELGSERVSLARRTSLRLILLELVRARESSAEMARSVTELFEAGWPGQRAHPDSASHRVHVAIASLRKLGLGEAIVTRGEGYALDPALALQRVSTG